MGFKEDVKDFKEKLNDVHEILTGNGDPKSGLVYKVAQLESDVQKYASDDGKMHSFMKKWMVVLTIIYTVDAFGPEFLKHPAVSTLLKAIGL